ncbi:hypothetical protein H311_02981 [Anncaliia algerae PRA109]|nr:hypothetical protein H311_02981 [Anncaliia algerae PRA109]
MELISYAVSKWILKDDLNWKECKNSMTLENSYNFVDEYYWIAGIAAIDNINKKGIRFGNMLEGFIIKEKDPQVLMYWQVGLQKVIYSYEYKYTNLFFINLLKSSIVYQE